MYLDWHLGFINELGRDALVENNVPSKPCRKPIDKRLVSSTELQKDKRCKSVAASDEKRSLTIEQLKIAFYMLGVCLAVALLVFAAEGAFGLIKTNFINKT